MVKMNYIIYPILQFNKSHFSNIPAFHCSNAKPLTGNVVGIKGKVRRFKLKRIESEFFQTDAIAAAESSQLRGYRQISMVRFGSINSGCI
jgi:hypothetical protein